MQTNNLPFQRIVFVCINERPPGERACCAHGGSVDLHARLKDMVKQRGLKRYVRVSKSGCMDRCEDGPNVMIFPDNVWFSNVGEGDLPAILDRLAEGIGSSR